MKFEKIILIIFVLILATTSVFGATIISASQVDFVSNDALLNRRAFLITGVENGGSQSVVFTLNQNNLGSTAQEQGYELTGTGTVKTSVENYQINYPTIIDGQYYYSFTLLCNGNDCLHDAINGVYSLSSTSQYCSEFSGIVESKIIVTKHVGELGWRCWKSEVVGTHAVLGTGQHTFNMNIDVTSPKGSDRIILTHDMTNGQTDIGDNRFTYAKIVTAGVTFVSPPTPDTRYDAVYKGNELYLTSKRSTSDFNNFYGYNGMYQVLSNCIAIQKSGTECQVELNNKVAEGLARATYLGDGTSSLVKDTTTTGRMVLSSLPTMYKQPIFSLIIDADWFGIVRPVGQPKIISLTADAKYTEGATNYIKATIKNEVDVDSSFDFSWNCNNAQVTGTELSVFSGLQSKDFQFQITGQTETGCTAGSCTLTVRDSENSAKQDTKSVNFQFCEQNQCNYAGETRCLLNSVEKCTSSNGALIWQTVTNCPNGCVIDSGFATCKQPDGYVPVCGDDVCYSSERTTGGEYYCPSDCTPKPGTNVVLIVGIIAGVGILGAVGLRLKKEGYFG